MIFEVAKPRVLDRKILKKKKIHTFLRVYLAPNDGVTCSRISSSITLYTAYYDIFGCWYRFFSTLINLIYGASYEQKILKKILDFYWIETNYRVISRRISFGKIFLRRTKKFANQLTPASES